MGWGTLSAQGSGGSFLVCWVLLKKVRVKEGIHITPPPWTCCELCYHLSSSCRPGVLAWPGQEVTVEETWSCPPVGLSEKKKIKKLHFSWDFSAQERTVCFHSMYSKVKPIHRNSPYILLFFLVFPTSTVFKKPPQKLTLPLVNSVTVKSLKICFVPAN